MKLDTLLSVFKKPTAESGASGDATVRIARRPTPPSGFLPQQDRPAAAPLPDEPIDTVQISVQASFVLAASQFDPQAITLQEASKLANQLLEGGAISRRERDTLASGPRDVDQLLIDSSATRDLLADFQAQLAGDVGRSDLRGIDESTRAVSILSRIVSLREAIG